MTRFFFPLSELEDLALPVWRQFACGTVINIIYAGLAGAHSPALEPMRVLAPCAPSVVFCHTTCRCHPTCACNCHGFLCALCFVSSVALPQYLVGALEYLTQCAFSLPAAEPSSCATPLFHEAPCDFRFILIED